MRRMETAEGRMNGGGKTAEKDNHAMFIALIFHHYPGSYPAFIIYIFIYIYVSSPGCPDIRSKQVFFTANNDVQCAPYPSKIEQYFANCSFLPWASNKRFEMLKFICLGLQKSMNKLARLNQRPRRCDTLKSSMSKNWWRTFRVVYFSVSSFFQV